MVKFGKVCQKNFLHYATLKSYFKSEDAPKLTANANGVESEWGGAKRFKRLKKAFDDLVIEVYLDFFSGVLLIFKETNLLLQREDPCIHLVHNQPGVEIRELFIVG